MRGFFGKIFLSFWLTGSIVMIASITAVVFLHLQAAKRLPAFFRTHPVRTGLQL